MLDSFGASAEKFSTRQDQTYLCPLFSKIGDYVARVLQEGYFTGTQLQVTTLSKQGIIYRLEGKVGSGNEPLFIGQWNQEIPFQETSFIDKGSLGVCLQPKGPVSFESVLDMSTKLGLVATLSTLGSDSERFKAQFDWQSKHAAVSTSMSFGVAPQLESSVVLGFSHLLVATQAVLDTSFKFASWIVACSYQDRDSGQVTLFIHDRGRCITCSYLHNISNRLSVAARFVYSAKVEQRCLSFGTQYYLDNETILKAKVDSSGMIGLSYIQQLTKNESWKVQIGISSLIDVACVEKKAPAMGISLQVES